MPSLNFKAEFAGLVESGKKRQTIREDNAWWGKLKPRDKLFLFTGLRTKNARTLITPYSYVFMYGIKDVIRCPGLNDNPAKYPKGKRPYVECKRILKIKISYTVFYVDGFAWTAGSAFGQTLAELDGFKNYYEMKEFFNNLYGLPFKGVIIQW